MGYDVLITRRAEVGDEGSGRGIERAEFERVVLGDPAFARDEGLGDGFAVAREWGGRWVQWREDGDVLCRDPGPEMIARLVAIAARLGARVVGEDGEEYGEDGRAKEGPRRGGWGVLVVVTGVAAVVSLIAWGIWGGR